MSNPPRVVLDTNVALDWLVFADARFALLARALEARQLVLVSDLRCLDELREVMGRAQLRISIEEQVRAAERYIDYAQMAPAAAARADLPLCRDADDQMFLELAERAGAAVLVSRDRELLRLDDAMRRLCGVAVQEPAGALLVLGLPIAP